MPTDEMLLQRFQTIAALIQMEEGEIENEYGLKPGNGEGPAYRKGTIMAICQLSIEELSQIIEDRAKNGP
jgi:hypothetical protein